MCLGATEIVGIFMAVGPEIGSSIMQYIRENVVVFSQYPFVDDMRKR